MKHKRMIYNDPTLAGEIVGELRILTIDIETNTTVPPGSAWTDSFGVSNSAPITYVSIYGEKNPPIVFSLKPTEGDYNYEELDTLTYMHEAAKHQVIVDAVTAKRGKGTSQGHRVIGHNLNFDLGRLGARFNFTIPNHCKTWDTMVMASRFMMGETNDDESIRLFELSLDSQLDMYGRDTIFFEETDTEFYKAMKKYRKNFDGLQKELTEHLYKVVIEEPDSPSFWKPYIALTEEEADFLFDVLRSIVLKSYDVAHMKVNKKKIAEKDKRREAIKQETLEILKNSDRFQMNLDSAIEIIIAHYVAMDTVHTHRLYKLQYRVLSSLEDSGITLNHVEHRFSESRYIPQWTGIRDLVDWEQRISRVSINQTIRGVPVDRDFIKRKQQEWLDTFPTIIEQIDSLPDPTDPSPDFEQQAMMAYWLHRVVEVFNKHRAGEKRLSSESTYSQPASWVNWEHHEVSKELLIDWIDWSDLSEDDEEFNFWQDMWLGVFMTMRPDMSKNSIMKGALHKGFQITKQKPQFDFVDWVHETCFADHPYGKYLAQYKADWLIFKFTRTKSSMYQAKELVGKKVFQRYFVFIKALTPIPDHNTIKYVDSLITPSHKKMVKAYKRLLIDIEQIRRGEAPNRKLTDEEVLMLSHPHWREKDDNESDPLTFEDAMIAVGGDIREIEPDYLQLALDYGFFAVKKKGLWFYLPPAEDDDDQPNPEHFDHPLRKLYDAFQLNTSIRDGDKYLLHSERDGKIHSVMARYARTGRFISNGPNMQNDNRDAVVGWIIPESDEYVIVGSDLSNAEKNTGAMTAGCSDMALTLAQGNYHSNMVPVYFPEQYAALKPGDTDGFKKLRSTGKAVTFGNDYGSGNDLMAIQTGLPVDEVVEIKKRIDITYPALAEAKRWSSKQAKNVETYPSYTTLWTGGRVVVPFAYRWKKGQRLLETQGYKANNYKQQGGVGEIIARGMVLITEWLEDNEKDSYVLFNVHDELVLCLKIDEADEVLTMVCKILAEVVPEDFRNRTNPPIYFVADIGPENARKWGYQDGVDYPLSRDHFWTQWGKIDLPDEELEKEPHKRETPTWRGPHHLGWTLENAMQERSESSLVDYMEDSIGINVVEDPAAPWNALKTIYHNLVQKKDELGLDISGKLTDPRSITIPYDGETRTFNNMLFTEWMSLAYVAYHRGHSNLYIKATQAIVQVLDYCYLDEELSVQATEWVETYSIYLEEATLYDSPD